MEIATTTCEGKATITVSGKLTVNTSPELEATVRELDATGSIVDYDIDLSGLEYISSAGLRTLVATHKLANGKGGTMRLLCPTDTVYEILDTTGLVDIMTIER